MGHICKICQKDGRLFATHSFKILGVSHDHILLYILVGVFCLGSSWAKNDILSVCSMAIRVVEFSNGGTKLERCLPKNQHTQRKLLNFENWVNGEVSKIGHH